MLGSAGIGGHPKMRQIWQATSSQTREASGTTAQHTHARRIFFFHGRRTNSSATLRSHMLSSRYWPSNIYRAARLCTPKDDSP